MSLRLVTSWWTASGLIRPASPWARRSLVPLEKNSGSAALVGLDVGQLVADDPVIRLAERGQSQGVGGGAVEDEEDLAIGFEHLAE